MWVEKLKNGNYKYVERYKDPLTGKLKKVSVTYEKHNKRLEAQAIIELDKKISELTSTYKVDEITVKQLTAKYLKYSETVNKYSTVVMKRSAMNNINEVIGSIKLSGINRIVLKDATNKLSNISCVHLRALLKWAYSEGYLAYDIPIKLTAKVKRENDKLYYEKNELKDIFQKLDNNSRNYNQKIISLIIKTLTYTGLRIGELVALTENDVVRYDIGGEITVNKSAFLQKIDTPKTKAGIRTIGINGKCIDIIDTAIDLKNKYDIDSNLIFPSAKSMVFDRDTIKYTLKKLNIDTRLHIYRHSHASMLAEQGFSLEEIQRRLGHESSGVTKKIYIHVTEKIKTEESKKFRVFDII